MKELFLEFRIRRVYIFKFLQIIESILAIISDSQIETFIMKFSVKFFIWIQEEIIMKNEYTD